MRINPDGAATQVFGRFHPFFVIVNGQVPFGRVEVAQSKLQNFVRQLIKIGSRDAAVIYTTLLCYSILTT